jgi:hypothetical protein
MENWSKTAQIVDNVCNVWGTAGKMHDTRRIKVRDRKLVDISVDQWSTSTVIGPLDSEKQPEVHIVPRHCV